MAVLDIRASARQLESGKGPGAERDGNEECACPRQIERSQSTTTWKQ